MPKIRCVVERITYRNEENGYTIIKTRVKDYSDLVPVVGNLLNVSVGSVLTVTGEWKIDKKFGRQFVATEWEETLPATVYGIEKYLGSGLIKGIGPKYAKKITSQFGEQTLDVIESEPERLIEVPGIGDRRVALIRSGWEQQKEIKNVMLFLQSHDVSTSHAARIYKAYGNESIKNVTENPYRLADDIWGIGFKTADTIAMQLGMKKEQYPRCRSGLLYALNKLSEDGHCYALRPQLISKACELLEVEESLLSITLDEMIRVKDVILEKGVVEAPPDSAATVGKSQTAPVLLDAIYLPPLFFSEVGVTKKITSLMRANREKPITDTDLIVATVERQSGIQYDEVQLQAIRCAITSKVMVLTGGPGTGKTTTTNSIIRVYQASGYDIVLAAPTGRAAKRMTEACSGSAASLEGKTIHRLLEYQPAEGYKVNEKNPLKGDVLIVDECSMIDVVLMYNLLKAVPDHMTLILIGDIDQLPSIGAGNVLRDIIASGVVPVVKLERVFRQAQGSHIITNAHRINKGGFPVISNSKKSDFFFIKEDKPEMALEQIIPLCQKRLPSAYHLNPISDIQVLTPMQRGVVGAVSLNKELQSALNPMLLHLFHGGTEYRLRDKVMQIKNNYDKGVFNGDIGFVSAVDTEERELIVTFDIGEVKYDISELDELILAYATTIHKAQGSEYPVVVMPVLMSHYVMLQRNLIYTGITRAKRLLVLIGSHKALAYAIQNNNVERRNTRLADRLREFSSPPPIYLDC